MKKLIWFLVLLLFLLPVKTSMAKEYFVVATGFNGGASGALDAIECEDIKGVNPPASATAITTGSIALVVDSNKVVAVYRYNASGTDSEDATNYTIIVPDDRTADCSGNGQWEKVDKYWLNEAIILDDGSGNTLTLGDGTALGSNLVVGTDELSFLIGVTSSIQTQINSKLGSDFNEVVPYEDYETCDDTCVSSNIVNLSGKGSHVKFDDAGTDEDTINQFTGLVAGGKYSFLFVDDYWTIDFSSSYIYGHNGIDWEPTAGDSMKCEAVDTSYLYCIVSRPTALAVTMYYDRPLDISNTTSGRWHGDTGQYIAGESLSQGDLVYMKYESGSARGEVFKWDADLATYKYFKPIGVVLTSGTINANDTIILGIGFGIYHLDAYTFFSAQDEGKTVYGQTTAGVISDTAPSTAGDIVCAVGTILADDTVQFNFGLCATVEVGS